jgi:hypothetical protein
MISGFRHEVAENCVLLGYYAASGGNLPTFRHNIGSIFRGQSHKCRTLKMGPIGCPEISVRSHHYCLRNNPEERSSEGNLLFFDASISVLEPARSPIQSVLKALSSRNDSRVVKLTTQLSLATKLQISVFSAAM